MNQIENLLQQVQVKVKHSKEISKLNGENFNIFSLLNLEANENRTHSRFLAELLNPKGSHEMGSLFLQNFLKVLDVNQDDIDFSSSTVIVEKYIGNRNDIDKSGGRIDIAISDTNGNNIFIENKIYAIDQIAQIERYCNYQTDKSKVYYLTLSGNEPEDISKGLLKSGTHFYCISYRDTIIKWLEICFKEAAEQPILRETIKQYIILIKKLTGQLTNDKMSKEVIELVSNNLQSAKAIVDNFQAAKALILNEIRTLLLHRLHTKLSKYAIRANDNISEKNSHIWLNYNQGSDQLFFGIEAFSGWSGVNNKLFMGILDIKELKRNYFIENHPEIKITNWWRGIRFFSKFDNYDIELSNIEFLQYLHNSKRVGDLVEHIEIEFIDYINEYEDIFIKIAISNNI